MQPRSRPPSGADEPNSTSHRSDPAMTTPAEHLPPPPADADVDLRAEDERRQRVEADRRALTTERERRAEEERREDREDADEAATAAAPASRAVVTEDDIQVMTRGEDLGVYRAKRRFGGLDLGAAVAGTLAATGMAALLGSLVGAIGTIGYQLDDGTPDADTVNSGGFIAGLVVLVLSFLVGGWVAGRVARYDGGLNGLVSAGIFVVFSAITAGLGAWLGDRYDIFADVSLPQWFSNQASATAVLSILVALAVMVAAGWFGGVIGSRYHRKADAYLAEYAQGGRPVTAETLLPEARGRRHLLHH
jgi:hypothetical protein